MLKTLNTKIRQSQILLPTLFHIVYKIVIPIIPAQTVIELFSCDGPELGHAEVEIGPDLGLWCASLLALAVPLVVADKCKLRRKWLF